MHWFRCCAVLLLILGNGTWGGIAFCADAVPPTAERTRTVEFRQMAAMPILVGSRRPNVDEAADKTLSCPIGVLCEGVQQIDPAAGRLLTRLVHDALQRKFPGRIVPLDSSREVFAAAMADASEQTPRSLARGIGRDLAADYVLTGTLWRYRDRGAVPGVSNSPASVAFALYLVDVETGRRIWRGIFDQTQQPLTENLLKARQSVKMGVKWLSARELAGFGVEQVMRSFPPEEDLRKPVKRDI